MGNYFDGQTAKFISVLATCLPPSLTSHIMQGWILNPKGLKKALTTALIYPTRPERPDPNVLKLEREYQLTKQLTFSSSSIKQGKQYQEWFSKNMYEVGGKNPLLVYGLRRPTSDSGIMSSFSDERFAVITNADLHTFLGSKAANHKETYLCYMQDDRGFVRKVLARSEKVDGPFREWRLQAEKLHFMLIPACEPDANLTHNTNVKVLSRGGVAEIVLT